MGADKYKLAITDRMISDYERDGVVFLQGAFSKEQVELLAIGIEKAMSSCTKHVEDIIEEDGRFFGDILLSDRFDEFKRFVMQSSAAEIACEIMRSDYVRLFYDQTFVKEPGTLAKTPWHQDKPYWPITGKKICSIWVALDEIDEGTSVEYVKGSHCWHEHAPAHFTTGKEFMNTRLGHLPDIDAMRSQLDIAKFAMMPGDCLIFNSSTVHGAPGNLSSRRRRAYVMRWMGDDVRFRQLEGERPNAISSDGIIDGAEVDPNEFPIIWHRSAQTESVGDQK